MSEDVLQGPALLALRMGLACPSVIALFAALWAALQAQKLHHPHKMCAGISRGDHSINDGEGDETVGRRRRPTSIALASEEPIAVAGDAEEGEGCSPRAQLLAPPPPDSLRARGQRAAPAAFLALTTSAGLAITWLQVLAGFVVGMAGALVAFIAFGWRFYSADTVREALVAGLLVALSITTFLLAGLGFSASLY